MSLKDLEPDGFSEDMRFYVSNTMPIRLFAQSFWGARWAIWLSVDGLGETMIGYGSPEEALEEAENTLKAQIKKVKKDMIAMGLTLTTD